MSYKKISLDVKKFIQLKKAAIDASSLIYLKKIDLLEQTSSLINLYTTPALAKETGFMNLSVILTSEGIEIHKPADEQLIALAIYKKCALISEDKKILRKADKIGLDYFNSLMIILFLFYKHLLSTFETQQKITELKQIARYGNDIWSYGEKLFKKIEMLGQ